MTLPQHFGARLRELREAKGLTQSELGFSRFYVSDLERAKKSVSLARIEEIAAILHCDPREFFRWAQSPSAAARDQEQQATSRKPRYSNGTLALMNERDRLLYIAAIIEGVDNRCAACDGPVTPTLQEMTPEEVSAIYALACGRNP